MVAGCSRWPLALTVCDMLFHANSRSCRKEVGISVRATLTSHKLNYNNTGRVKSKKRTIQQWEKRFHETIPVRAAVVRNINYVVWTRLWPDPRMFYGRCCVG